MKRDGAIWITLARQSSCRNRSSLAPALKKMRPCSRPASATLSKVSAGRSAMKRDAAAGELQGGGNRIVLGPKAYCLDRERLVEEFAGRIVVLDRELRAGDAVIGCGLLHERDSFGSFRATEIPDRNVQCVGSRRDWNRGKSEQPDKNGSDQASAPLCPLADSLRWLEL